MRGATRTGTGTLCRHLYFNPRTPCGVRPAFWWIPSPAKAGFQSTHPMRGATRYFTSKTEGKRDFNPRTPCGVRLTLHGAYLLLSIFQSTHPMRGATYPLYLFYSISAYFNPRTPCGVRHDISDLHAWRAVISIHAPHAGCDSALIRLSCRIGDISIHAPHAGCDDLYPNTVGALHGFQSTHPMRGATQGQE